MLRSLLLAALLVPAASAQGVHDTGRLRLGVSNDGSVGAETGRGTAPLVFSGRALLYDGHFLAGTGPESLSGRAYGDFSGPADWAPGDPVAEVPDGTRAGLQTFRATFSDTAAPSPLGLTVTQTSRSYARAGTDGLVALAYEIRNGSTKPLSGVYAGLFADFDVSAAGQDQGGFDDARRLAYMYDGAGPYAGQVLLGTTPLSGWAAALPSFATDDTGLFRAMTTLGQVSQGATDRATLIGTGPFTIPAGGSVLVQYALVVGSTLTELRAAADAARSQFTPGEAGPSAARGVALHPAQPNPATGRTVLMFTLDAPQPARLVVTDVLGREVAVLVDGPQSAGEHTAMLDAARLPAGVYVARLTAGAERAVQRLTVAR